jgi:hypothetical protein
MGIIAVSVDLTIHVSTPSELITGGGSGWLESDPYCTVFVARDNIFWHPPPSGAEKMVDATSSILLAASPNLSLLKLLCGVA